MSDGTEPITDDEILYRRIPERPDYFDAENDARASPLAFKPREDDTTGLSVYRAKYGTPEEVARNNRGKRFYIGFLLASDLRAHGMEIVPKPNPPEQIGHAEIPELTFEGKNTKRGKELQVKLAEKLCFPVKGPYPKNP